MSCFGNNIPCFKFLLTAIISLSILGFSMTMLGLGQFKNNSLTAFCCSLITSAMAFWFEPPKVYEKPPLPRLPMED